MQENKHILFISSEPLGYEKMPLASVYVLDQIELIKPYFDQVGILAVAYLPTSKFFLAPRYYKYENAAINGVIYNTAVKKKFYPLKFISRQRQYDASVARGMKRFKSYVNQYGLPDLIHAHNSFFAGLLAIEIKKIYRIPVVLTEHSSVMYGDLSAVEIGWLRNIYEHADIVVTVSEGLAKKLLTHLDLSPDTKGIEIVPNALNPLFESILSVDGLKKDGFTFITVGNLVDVKNQMLLLEAFSMYFNSEKDVKLIIIGEGPLRSQLLAHTHKLGIHDQIEFTGYLNKEEVKSKLSNADVFVLSSRFETYGIAVMEALSCGLPVVTTPCRGPEMMIKDTNGRTVSDHTPKALGEMMSAFRKNEFVWDNALIRKECIKNFGGKSFVEKLMHLYKLLKIRN